MRVIVHAVPGYQVISTVRDSRIETGEETEKQRKSYEAMDEKN